jgi:YVTN family beta-propeller protein
MQGKSSKKKALFWARELAVLCAVLALAIGLGARPVAAAPFAYVTNYNSSTVSVIDTATNTVVATIGIEGKPIAAAVSPDGKRVYVACQGSFAGVSVLETASNTVTAKIAVGNGTDGVAVTPDGKHAYVASAGSPTRTPPMFR